MLNDILISSQIIATNKKINESLLSPFTSYNSVKSNKASDTVQPEGFKGTVNKIILTKTDKIWCLVDV